MSCEEPESPPIFAHLQRLLAEPLLLVSAEGRVVDVSPSACSLVGLNLPALRGRMLAELVEGSREQVACYLRLCARSVRPLPGVLMLRRDPGTPVRHHCQGARLQPQGDPPLVLLRVGPEVGGGPGFALLSQKVAQLTQEVHRRRQTEEVLRRVLELQEQLIGIVSHDVRSPLSAILMSTRQLEQLALDERAHKLVERVTRSGWRIEQVVRLLLDFTRARLGKGIPIQVQPLEVQELCTRVVDELKAAYPQHTVRLQEARVQMEGDPERLTQVIVNLVENAFKYGAAGRPVGLSMGQAGEEVWIAVHNEGQPIAAELRPRLFEPFSRGTQTEKTVKVSLGLGLYIVREIVRAHGGEVCVRSTLPEGTTFTLRLPRRRRPSAPASPGV